jgi:hypothetical protein
MDEAERIARFYEKHGIRPPTSEKHGTEEDIRGNMQAIKPNKWHLDGNLLVGETDQGTLCQRIPSDYILVDVVDNLPVFKRVVL